MPEGGYRTMVTPGASDLFILPRTFPYATISGPTARDFDLSGTEWSGLVRLSGSGNPVPSTEVRAYLIDDQHYRSAVSTTDAGG